MSSVLLPDHGDFFYDCYGCAWPREVRGRRGNRLLLFAFTFTQRIIVAQYYWGAKLNVTPSFPAQAGGDTMGIRCCVG